MADLKSNSLTYRRDDLNDQLLAYEIRGVNVERMDYNQHVPDARQLLETLVSDVKGEPIKDLQDLTDFTDITFANMTNKDAFMALHIWAVFIFLLDDFLESQTTKLVYWVRKWEQKITDRHSSGTDFMDLFYNEFRVRMNKALPEKFIQLHDTWCMNWLSFYAETDKVKNGHHIYTIDEYEPNRIIDAGYPILQMFQFVSTGFDPDEYPEIATDDAWTMFNLWAGRHNYYVNDLYSSKKEILQHQGKHTFIYIVMCQYKCDAQTAADKIVTMIDRAWTMVIKYGDMLRLHNVPSLDRYITDIMVMLKGNIYWSDITPRYNKLSKYDNYQLAA